MKLARIENDTSLDALMQRLLRNATGPEADAARERLLELNPQLAEFDKLPKGTPVLLPETDTVTADQRTEDALDALAEIFEDAIAARTQTLAEREQAIDEVLALGTDSVLLNYVNPQQRTRMEAIANEAKTRRADIPKERAAFQKEIDRLRDLAKIRGPRRRAVRS